MRVKRENIQNKAQLITKEKNQTVVVQTIYQNQGLSQGLMKNPEIKCIDKSQYFHQINNQLSNGTTTIKKLTIIPKIETPIFCEIRC